MPRIPKTFHEQLEDYVYSKAKTAAEFYNTNVDKTLISKSTFEGWIFKQTLPDLKENHPNKLFNFIPKEDSYIKEALTELCNNEWIAKKGLSVEMKNFKDIMSTKPGLDKILDDYLKDKAIPNHEKSLLGFIDRIKESWSNINDWSLSKALGLNENFIGKLRRKTEKDKNSSMDLKSLKNFSNKVEHTSLPKEFYLSQQKFLQLCRLAYAKKETLPEGEPEKTDKKIIASYQSKITDGMNFEERQKIGQSAFRELAKYYGFTGYDLETLLGEKSAKTYSSYIDNKSVTNMNNITYMTNPEGLKKIAFNLYGDTPKLANEFANLLVGLKKFYEPEDLYEDLISKKITYNEAIFIARYQSGKSISEEQKDLHLGLTRDEMADKLGIKARAYARREVEGNQPHSSSEIHNFAQGFLGMEKTQENYDSKVGALFNCIMTSKVNFLPQILDRMQKGLEEYMDGAKLVECYSPRDAITEYQKSRDIVDEVLERYTGKGFGLIAIKKLKQTGTLPDFIDGSNKNTVLDPMASAFGLSSIDWNDFSTILLKWSHAIKSRKGHEIAEGVTESPSSSTIKISRKKAKVAPEIQSEEAEPLVRQ